VTESSVDCPFCRIAAPRILAEGVEAVAFRDGHPLNPGHVLIVPRRHVASWFDATAAVTWVARGDTRVISAEGSFAI
jgi:diadenosine tetraphosphate (Ap4A) HIT family hydrolase